MKELLLVSAGLVTIFSVLPYILDTLKGKTKPNVVSWLTWTILTGIATIAEVADQEYRTAIFTGIATIATSIVVVLGVKLGTTKYTSFDIICQVSALIGIGLWIIMDSPALAVVTVVAIDLIGALPTIRHAFLKPSEETWQTFTLAGLGGIFAIMAFTSYNWTSLTYAVYIVFVNAVLTAVIILRRQNQVAVKSD